MSHNTDRKPNRLIHETSPYLLQHAYNPVDWHPWGEAALQEAKQADKPILVSIGYAACHWCHVMERESFEDERIAALMNEYFVCIKVDREERPDVDHIYMDAVQAISGHGGWPLNMFLTPEGKPFYGGTYFPPVGVHGRPSWSQVLNSIHQTFVTNRAGVDDRAEKLTEYLSKSDNNLLSDKLKIDVAAAQLFTEQDADTVFNELKKRFDKQNGGYGGAPKFPNTLSTQYLFRHYYHTGNKQALQHALLSLDKMIQGGIYDQLGGGFARYSVDDHWLAPHFEKMLYDNALLVAAMGEAYQITQLPIYKVAVEQALGFVERELYHPDGGFYAALDADSEGHEGKFYVWSKAEVEQLLGSEAELFCQFYDVTDEGNWEGTNILHMDMPLAAFAEKHGLDAMEVESKLANARQKLFDARTHRVRPGLDDKVILSWNAMMCSGYIKAYEAFGSEHYLSVAQKNLQFLLEQFWVAENGQWTLKHTYKNGQAKYPAFLDDYACLIEALIDMYEVTFDEQHLETAQKLTEKAIQDFHDPESGQFFYTPAFQTDVIFRKKELFDSVTPSGNSTMAYNLNRLAVITGRKDWERMADDMVAGIKTSMLNYSTSFTKWAMVMLRYIYPVKEIAVVGSGYHAAAKDIRQQFIPNKVLMGSDRVGDSPYPLLQHRLTGGNLLIYLCEDYACQQPYNNVKALLAEISKGWMK